MKVRCTEKALRQALTNLVDAIKYTERGQIRVSATPTDDGVELVVSDAASAFQKSTRTRITRPFEQVDDVYARREGGAGLGLSIVTSIVAHAGGRMRLDSKPGKGTRVTILLRRAGPDRGSPRPPARGLIEASGEFGDDGDHGEAVALFHIDLLDSAVLFRRAARFPSSWPRRRPSLTGLHLYPSSTLIETTRTRHRARAGISRCRAGYARSCTAPIPRQRAASAPWPRRWPLQ